MTAVIAVVGHVDHGKSSLVTALTGHDTDRLANEAEAQHTIEVNPAHLPATDLTLLDVPGHLDWATATLAGLGAATHALVVVAADDGVMPQTREHLDAIRALGLAVPAVAVTRVDLPDARPRDATVAVRAELERRGLRTDEVVRTSTITGIGLATLARRLAVATAPAPLPPVAGPDLWVDRAFTVPGRGRVVTGTLARGRLAVGDLLVDAATGTTVRVRGLQRRGEEHDDADATERVALRVDAGGTLHRGSRLVGPDVATHGLLSGRFEAVVDVFAPPLARRGAWMLHVGTSATAVRLHLRGDTGPAGLVTVTPDGPLPIRPGDRFVLRDTGRVLVAGGGVALVPSRRGSPDRDALTRLADAMATVDRSGLADALAAANGGAVTRAHARTILPLPDGDGWLVTPARRDQVRRVAAVADGSATAPRHARIAAMVGLPEPVVAQVLADATAAPTAPAGTAVARSVVVAAVESDRWSPSANDDLLADLGIDRGLLHAVWRSGDLHAAGRFSFGPAAVAAALVHLGDLPAPFTVADARTCLGITRRHAVPLLELLDRLGHTRPDEDRRRRVVSRPDR